MITIKCSACENMLMPEMFHERKGARGRAYKCKECARKWQIEHRADPDIRKRQAAASKLKYTPRERKKMSDEERRTARCAAYARYKKKYPEKNAARSSKNRAKKANRTVEWACPELMKRNYEYAKLMAEITGEPWHVDHMVPMQGKNVSGLHVHNNLQVIRGSENMAKGNRY